MPLSGAYFYEHLKVYDPNLTCFGTTKRFYDCKSRVQLILVYGQENVIGVDESDPTGKGKIGSQHASNMDLST